MEKSNVVEQFQKEGYRVVLENNVPMFTLSIEEDVAELRKKLRAKGYGASFGYRKVAGMEETVPNGQENAELTTEAVVLSEGKNGQYFLF